MKRKKSKTSIYKRIFVETCNEYTEIPLSDTKRCYDCVLKMCVAGVKWLSRIHSKELDKDEEFYEKAVGSILQGLAILKPDKIAEIFPPQKFYDGDKYGCKDYYYAMECIELAKDHRLTKNNVIDLLEDLTNRDLWNFCIAVQWYLNIKELKKQQRRYTAIRSKVASNFEHCIILDNVYHVIK